MRVTSGIVSTLQQKTTTGFAPNDRGVASDDLVVDNPMSGRADCTNVGISGHCGLHQGVSGNDTLAKLRPVFVLHMTRNCSVSPLFVFKLKLTTPGRSLGARQILMAPTASF